MEDTEDNLISLIGKYCEKSRSPMRLLDIDDIENMLLKHSDVDDLVKKRFEEIQQIGELITQHMHDKCVCKQI